MNDMKTLNNAGKSVAAIIIIFVASVAIPQLFGQSKKTLEGAFYWKNGKACFFKGNRYVRYDISADRVDPGYPKSINNETWPGLPWTDGIDTAVNWDNGKVYFFRGNQYCRYDINTDRADAGYPKSIDNETWPGVAMDEWNRCCRQLGKR
jgi:hypothetical protein